MRVGATRRDPHPESLAGEWAWTDRWAVERGFAWITTHPRLSRDYERDSAVSEAMIRWAAINTITPQVDLLQPALRSFGVWLTKPAPDNTVVLRPVWPSLQNWMSKLQLHS